MKWSAALGAPGARALRPAQEAYLAAAWGARGAGGAWGPRGPVALLGCGHGKTLCALLAPAALSARRPLILTPAALLPQLRADAAEWGREYPAILATLARAELVSYERLSAPSASSALGAGVGLLDQIRPDLVVADEAHLLGNPESSRWKRLARWFLDHPETRFAPLSGTLTWRSVRQVAHVLHVALRDASPIPPWAVASLSAVVDVGGQPSSLDWSRVEELLGPLPTRDKGTARRALHARLLAAPGVVYAEGVAADVSLEIEVVRRPPDYPAELSRAHDRLRTRWELPDGTELVDAIEVHAARRSLVWGWWARWREAAHRDPAWAPWFAARAAWADAVRRAGYAGVESPGVAAELARRGALPAAACEAWRAWEAVREAAPAREVVWLSPDVRRWTAAHLGAAARSRRAGPGGTPLVWYASQAIGEALRGERIPVYGPGSAPPAPGDYAAASWRVHGRGWNGQTWPESVIAETPDSGGEWEQLLARSHRPGQTEDVRVRVLAYTEEIEELLRSAWADARYATDVLGQPQRLTLASWPNGRPG